MKIIKTLFFLSTILFVTAAVYAGEFTVIRVLDGNTFIAKGHDIQITVLLINIKAPIMKRGKRLPGQPYSQRSQSHLSKLILDKKVNIISHAIGANNEIMAVVTMGDTNINLEMIKEGLAEVDKKGKPPATLDFKQYLKAEREAKDKHIGIWSDVDHMSPQEWMKKQRSRRRMPQ